MKKAITLLILSFRLVSSGYEISLPEEEVSASSCKLSMQLGMTPPEVDAATGRAVVEVRLINNLGNPLSGYQIQLTSTQGTFLCQLPDRKTGASDDSEPDRTCFFTAQDGRIKVHLVNLPLDGGIVQVKAVCDCGGYQVYASGNINYNKKVIKRKK